MNILWLRPSTGENVSVRRERIASVLRERGYTVDICDASGVDALGAIKKAVTGNYDVIAGNVRIGLYLGYPLARLLRKPFLGDVSDPISDIESLPDPLFRLFQWYEWVVLSRADAAVFVYHSSYQKALDKDIKDAVRLPNAVDYERFADPEGTPVAQARDALSNSGVAVQDPVAIYIGILSDEYHIKDILAAAERAPAWQFVFLGEGPLAAEVNIAAESQQNVFYPGSFAYDMIPGFLSHADVGFCFKDAEQPLKLKEYGAAGLPIIAQPGVLSALYSESELSFVTPNPAAIANELKILRSDQTYYDTLAESSQAIGKQWTWEQIAEGYDELFRQLHDAVDNKKQSPGESDR